LAAAVQSAACFDAFYRGQTAADRGHLAPSLLFIPTLLQTPASTSLCLFNIYCYLNKIKYK